MPTEFERKFVIQIGCEKEIAKRADLRSEISQGYLIATRGITVRVRKSTGAGKDSYYFTLKVNTAGRCVEIEDKIDARDFNDLWNISVNKLEKIRYTVRSGKDDWELDFFKDYKNETYMAVAEIELPEGVVEPGEVPDFIRSNLIYKVPLTDTRFSNKLLGDARYASNLLREIIGGKRSKK